MIVMSVTVHAAILITYIRVQLCMY